MDPISDQNVIFSFPFSDMKWWCPYEAKKCPIPYVGSREHKPHPISDQKGLSLHPILDQKGPKPYPLALRIPMQPGVFEQLTSTGSGLFSFLDGGFAQICG